jgi:hypothetical protein
VVAKQSFDAGCRGAAPIMESLLCGLGLGSDEPTADERQQASSWTALSSYITGPTSDEPSISRGYDWPEPPPSSPPRQSPWPIEARAPSPAAAAWAPDNLPARSSAAPAVSGTTASPPSSPTAPRTFLVAATVRSPSDPRGRGTPARRRPPSPVVNVRSAERRFLDEFLVMLADGFKMRKHGRRGGPKDRLVRLDGDMIVWTAVRPSFRLSERGGVSVADVTEVRRTFAGRPRPANVAEDRCLSLITAARSVDLELPDNEVRELCHDGFSLLMKFGPPVTTSPSKAASTSTPSSRGVDPLGRPRTPPRVQRIPSIDHDME